MGQRLKQERVLHGEGNTGALVGRIGFGGCIIVYMMIKSPKEQLSPELETLNRM